jgi:anti-sigma factor RsiW
VSEARQDIDEAELHAYVDGLLDEDRRMTVESVLADDADATETARTYREQNSRLTTLFGDITDEPIPERLSVDRIVRSGVWWRRVRSMAAAALWLAIGLGSGWGANDLLR